MAVSQAVHADSLDEQRNRYAQIKQAWDNKQMDTVQALMPTLKDYPLYPYLEYRQITDDLMNQPTVTVNNFIQANPTLPPARTLKSRFVNELARREDWRGLLAFSPDKPGATERSVITIMRNGRPVSRGSLDRRERAVVDGQKPAKRL
jgi:peptidoglycan lytic transglycosylase (EC 3.2.1.-). Glycosyl Hydrolase family 23.